MGRKDEGHKRYKELMQALYVELVRLQDHVIENDLKLLIIFEGRDAAGKDGVVKRITRYLRPRETRIVALGKPSDRDRRSWYFQRYVPHLPAGGELVLFNRSWYNRAGVEPVMGFCTEHEHQEFLHNVPHFEQMLIRSGITLLKYYLDISRDEQAARMDARRDDPLRRWKISPVDAVALEHWDDYSRARNEMFARTHSPVSPWMIVRADDKRSARVNAISDILSRFSYAGKVEGAVTAPNPNVVFSYDESYLENGLISP